MLPLWMQQLNAIAEDNAERKEKAARPAPTCPRCETAPVAMNEKTGEFASYCPECRRAINKEYRKRLRGESK